MKVLVLGGSSSRNSGGMFTAATMLAQSLSNNCDVDLHFLMYNDEYSIEDRKFYAPFPLHNYSVIGPKRFAYSVDLLQMIKKIKPDVIHTQGIWMHFSYTNKKYNNRTKTPYVISPQGMLDPWQMKQSFNKDLVKQIALLLFEKKHLNNANCIQAVSKYEYSTIRNLGLKSPVAIIPNGIGLPSNTIRDENYTLPYRWRKKGDRKVLLFLGRINNKKGLSVLLHAWSITHPKSHQWQLIIAGETKDTTYLQSLIRLTQTLNISDSVTFIGGQFGKDKETCLIDADAFVLPSFSEGLPLAVLEAWSYKLPVIMTPYCNIPEGFTANAAIKIDPSAESIASGIKFLFSCDDNQRLVMGENGYNLVKDKFTWDKVAGASVELYEWLLGVGPKPEFVFDNE